MECKTKTESTAERPCRPEMMDCTLCVGQAPAQQAVAALCEEEGMCPSLARRLQEEIPIYINQMPMEEHK